MARSDRRGRGSAWMAILLLLATGCARDGGGGSLQADPLLDAQKKLLASSPAIDQGLNNTIVRYDIDRVVRTSPYDIGGDEY